MKIKTHATRLIVSRIRMDSSYTVFTVDILGENVCYDFGLFIKDFVLFKWLFKVSHSFVKSMKHFHRRSHRSFYNHLSGYMYDNLVVFLLEYQKNWQKSRKRKLQNKLFTDEESFFVLLIFLFILQCYVYPEGCYIVSLIVR